MNKYSAYKIVWYPEKLKSFRSSDVAAPICVRIKPTNRCNHDCFWCVFKASFSGMHPLSTDREKNWKGPVAELPVEKILEILDDLADMRVKAVILSGGGEPLLHPDIETILNRILELGIELAVITNGQRLFGDIAELLKYAAWVRVSMDYTCSKQFEENRGLNAKCYHAIIKNIEEFAGSQRSCDFFINYVVHRKNYQDLIPFACWMKALHVDSIRFSPVWTPAFTEYHRNIAGSVTAQINAMKRLLDDDHFKVDSTYDPVSPNHSCVRTLSRCYVMQTVPVIAADAHVYACHNKAYDPKGLIGTIADQRFKRLWFSEEAKKAFQTLNPMEVCKHECAADHKNRLVHEILNTNDAFI